MPKDSLIVDPKDAASDAGLVHVSDDMPGITRRRSGKGFSYRDAKGDLLRDKRTLDRIRALAIPPAYADVWICANPRGHLQATGRDARGRKQYRYHPKFRAFRDSAKFEHMLDFAASLPRIRARVDADMSLRGLGADKVLATIVHLLEVTMIRVGNDIYARDNKSHGLTTLRDRHARISGSNVQFRFKGKGGKEWDIGLRDRRVATTLRKVQDLPGQRLFQYLDEDGTRCSVTSTEVNDYLRDISGREVTAKDFRTWTGTVLAAMALAAYEAFDSEAAAKRNVREAIVTVAATLGNTPAICRKCYIHPMIIDAYLADDLKIVLRDEIEQSLDGTDLTAEERQVMRLLKKRLKT
ncbi:DNA topoisomerase IB [Paracoccus shanxieyensis]|uniref:DNA topoisomerase IB n=1 Tax=Paracoccus shanxieyensis TaxID=2675752 RepID=A0A6L6J033_9RHOB|nr:DNA topoisomerase IB [Paracoccus shanxieyensis]MTH65893.1 DNA topoisomerase IB [Paracoccus shanxieyensis]MTH89198.1 DNA topoisomerase IB [Paracoccus shanxieyensis]